MKRKLVKLSVIAICLAMLGSFMTSCGVFFDEENNFVGLHNIITAIYGE